jgi:hypothetical protein
VVEAVGGPVRAVVPRTGAKAAKPLEEKVQEVCELVTTKTREQLARVKLSDLAHGHLAAQAGRAAPPS